LFAIGKRQFQRYDKTDGGELHDMQVTSFTKKESKTHSYMRKGPSTHTHWVISIYAIYSRVLSVHTILIEFSSLHSWALTD
jgi:hypothetical protein